MKRFRKVYIEITNICNLQCTFCPEVVRDKKIMTLETFENVIHQVSPLTEEVCLHLMGEPLAHPSFKQIIELAEKANVKINLTTNGTLIKNYSFDFFFRPVFRQINFSIQSFKDNFPEQDLRPYLYDILLFSRQALVDYPELYINYRLWNLKTPKETREDNQIVIDYVSDFFQKSINERIDVGFKKSKNITGRIYFHFDSRFEWPSLNLPPKSEHGFCYGLSSHIGIHADGTLVPCCLDKEANIPLGNVLKTRLEDLLNLEEAQKIRIGFTQKKLIHPLCQSCDFIQRFN